MRRLMTSKVERKWTMKTFLLATALACAFVGLTRPASAADIVNDREDFLAFAHTLEDVASRQDTNPTKTCDADGCEVFRAIKVGDEFFSVAAETFKGKRDIMVVCHGKPADYPYRACNDSEGRMYREKLMGDGQFHLESLSRMAWPMPKGLY
jgi:hypothetical protein